VPPGTGMLNIMIVKLKAEKIASSGTVQQLRQVSLSFVDIHAFGHASKL